jgi:anaerobic magnesium-protoporphyrin IX monomethyl ester cyclase
VDGIDPELAQLAKDSGCITMCMGVESVSQTSLDIINKNISVEKAQESIDLLKKIGIETRIYMILGLPGEPDDIVDQT